MGLGATVLVGILTALVLGLGREAVRRYTEVQIGGTADVIDGDSLRIAGKELRLMGIDAPEYRQTCLRQGQAEQCGKAARDALRGLVHAGVSCTVAATDRYGRGLARCRAGALDVNRTMVLQGQAVAFGDYQADEDEARRRKRGIWATTFQRPADWRAAHPREEDSR